MDSKSDWYLVTIKYRHQWECRVSSSDVSLTNESRESYDNQILINLQPVT